MDTWDVIRSRRNVHAYEPTPIPEGDLERVLEAGRLSPSASNRQKWEFVVVRDRARLEALAKVWQGARHLPASAATIALILANPENERYRLIDQFDLGQATMLLELAAADLGIGSGHSAVGEQDLAREILGVPETHYVAYLLALGYPADRPLAPLVHVDRRPFDDIVRWDHW